MTNKLPKKNNKKILHQGQNRPVNQGQNHKGNLPLNQEQKLRWEIAFKAEEAHLATQREFHTVKFTRYENRDKQYLAENDAWNQNSDIRTRFRAVMDAHKNYTQIQNSLNETIDKYQKARGPFLKNAREARKNALQWQQNRVNLENGLCNDLVETFSVIPNHQVANNLKGKESKNLTTIPGHKIQVDKEIESMLNKTWQSYIEAAKIANDSQKEIHIVEFKEFDGRQECVNNARLAIEQGNATPKLMREVYQDGLQKIQQEVRKTEIEIADKKRKANAKDVQGLFKIWNEALKDALSCSKNKKYMRPLTLTESILEAEEMKQQYENIIQKEKNDEDFSHQTYTKATLGNMSWQLLHVISATCPEVHDDQERFNLNQYQSLFAQYYPCKECSEHFIEVVKENTYEGKNRKEFMEFVCKLHNIVNVSLNKKEFPVHLVEKVWGRPFEQDHKECPEEITQHTRE